MAVDRPHWTQSSQFPSRSAPFRLVRARLAEDVRARHERCGMILNPGSQTSKACEGASPPRVQIPPPPLSASLTISAACRGADPLPPASCRCPPAPGRSPPLLELQHPQPERVDVDVRLGAYVSTPSGVVNADSRQNSNLKRTCSRMDGSRMGIGKGFGCRRPA